MELYRLKEMPWIVLIDKNERLTRYGSLLFFALKQLARDSVYTNQDGELFTISGDVCRHFNTVTEIWEVYGGTVTYDQETRMIEWVDHSTYVDEILN